ncbi:MAG: hypothetical protein A2Y62_19990 [Candidatus Fischerbacteria bacterium RBG_13_37_8]|uniref:TonB C-terminal domain-containing protein n=1 Tax=Candidatus Fischerbacteria bacterium RBG_13_37_8 TaxID=1817863 RepID=A0A1F5V793_9BACT|nr:MAG: hypothetical protein A2Y62_19990 [Candidatus Fischerbacteria bacterium RBG_13_37_8]
MASNLFIHHSSIFDGIETRRGLHIDRQRLALFPVVITIHLSLILLTVYFSTNRPIIYVDEPPVWISINQPWPVMGSKFSNAQDGMKNQEQISQKQAGVPAPVAPSYIQDKARTEESAKKEPPQSTAKTGDPSENAKLAVVKTTGTVTRDAIVALLKAEPPVRIGIEGIQPVVLKRVQPDYPDLAENARIEGIVIVEAVISKYGTVVDVHLLKSVHPVLDRAAIEAVYQWLFEPGKINGVPTNAYYTLTIIFTIKDDNRIRETGNRGLGAV